MRRPESSVSGPSVPRVASVSGVSPDLMRTRAVQSRHPFSRYPFEITISGLPPYWPPPCAKTGGEGPRRTNRWPTHRRNGP